MVTWAWWFRLPPSGRCAILSALLAAVATGLIFYNFDLDTYVFNMLHDDEIAPIALSCIPVGIATIAIAHWADTSKQVFLPMMITVLTIAMGVAVTLWGVRGPYVIWTILFVFWSAVIGFFYQFTLESERLDRMRSILPRSAGTLPKSRPPRVRRRPPPDEGPGHYDWDD